MLFPRDWHISPSGVESYQAILFYQTSLQLWDDKKNKSKRL